MLNQPIKASEIMLQISVQSDALSTTAYLNLTNVPHDVLLPVFAALGATACTIYCRFLRDIAELRGLLDSASSQQQQQADRQAAEVAELQAAAERQSRAAADSEQKVLQLTEALEVKAEALQMGDGIVEACREECKRFVLLLDQCAYVTATGASSMEHLSLR